jgi:uncharacterized repeat protein (TIGR03943 family)
VRQALRGVLLLALAGLICKLLLTGQMALYMSPALDPLSVLAALVLAVLGAVELWSARRVSTLRRSSDELLTYVPVAALLGAGAFVTPRALDSTALGGMQPARAVVAYSAVAGSAAQPPTSAITDLPDLFKYLRTAGESGVGQPVRVVGMAVPDASLAPDQFVLLRYTIVHCVADAQPIGLLIEASETPPSSGGWVVVEGVLAVSPSQSSRLVSVRATRVLPTDEPAEPYVWNL